MRLLFSSQQPTPAPTSGGVATTAPRIADTGEIQGNKPQTPEPQKAPAPVKDSKPFYQPILDFFKNLYEKFMDFFTPTSKEAIEKSLAKAASKQRKYLDRISLQEALQSPEKCPPIPKEPFEALSDIQRETIIQDGQKATKKLEALTHKIEKLSARYENLIGATKASTTTAAENTVTTKPEAAVEKTAADATEETAESLEKGLKEFAEDLAQQGEESLNKIKPVLGDFLEQLKVLLK